MSRWISCLIAIAFTSDVSYAQNCLTDNIGNGWIGVYADQAGTNTCIDVPLFTPISLYVIASLEGASATGIRGAEFGIQFSDLANTAMSFSGAGSTTIGDPIDSEPSNPNNSFGVDIAFSNCQLGPRVLLGTIAVVAFGPIDSIGIVVTSRHPAPNPSFAAPLLMACDSEFTKIPLTPTADVLGRDPITFRGSINRPDCVSCAPPTLHAPMGLYAGPTPSILPLCAPQGVVSTFHLVGRAPASMPFGVTGANFRVDVANPDGYFFSYTPPANAQAFGSPTQGGTTLQLANCTAGSPDDLIELGTLSVFNQGGEPTSIRIRTGPGGGNYPPCPFFFGCDEPFHSPICMSPLVGAPDVVFYTNLNPPGCEDAPFVPETFLLDTREATNDGAAGPVQTQQLLADGVTYSIRVEGTVSPVPAGAWLSPPGVICGIPELAPRFLSGGTTNHWVGTDAEVHFAVPLPPGGDCESLPMQGYPRRHSRLQIDLGDGFEDLDPTGIPFTDPAPNHSYHYVVIGRGAVARFRWDDPMTDDNYGALQITVDDAVASDVRELRRPPVSLVELHRNWPDPFNPTTQFDFTLREGTFADVAIIDVRGRVTRHLRSQQFGSGAHRVSWDGQRDDGSRAPSGVYYVRVRTSGGTVAERMTLLK